jgi:two-component system cell cycle response regulator
VVADDDQSLLSTLTWILKDKGYAVIPVPGGVELMRRLDDEDPDLLMLDIMMPKVDGLQLLKEVKSDERWRYLPVLMISSMPPEDATVRSLGLGASDFIAKPFRIKELLARVEAHVRTGRTLREARDEAERRKEEADARAEMVDILHEVTDALAPDEIYHILARRVAKVLGISKCSMVLAKADDETAVVVVAAENPMLRNLEIRLAEYPEIRKALATDSSVLVSDVREDPLYEEIRQEWTRKGIVVPTRSVIAVPFSLGGRESGVFFLRTMEEEPPLTEESMEFAQKVIRTAVNAIEKAYALQTAQSDKDYYHWLATRDPLTGCLNRRALMDKLESEIDRARRYGLAISILMIDLDRFKQINDRHGHLVGDSVLRQVGDILRREVRSVDSVARYGGEEFVIVLPETGVQGALTFAERIRVRVGGHDFAEAGDPVLATVSIGVACVSGKESSDSESLIALADKALYRAKNGGRNQVRA